MQRYLGCVALRLIATGNLQQENEQEKKQVQRGTPHSDDTLGNAPVPVSDAVDNEFPFPRHLWAVLWDSLWRQHGHGRVALISDA